MPNGSKSSFDTSSVTDMSNMFYNCSSLSELDVSHFNTSETINMSSMFNNCAGLTEINISDWDINNVTNMSSMFANCRSLIMLDLRNWDISTAVDSYNNGVNVDNMFQNCNSLQELHLENCNNFTISKIINSSNFPVGNIGTPRIIYCKYRNIGNLEVPDGWEFNCIDLPAPDVPIYEVGQFRNNATIEVVETAVTPDHKDLSYMFYGCTALKSINTKVWYVDNVTNMNYMFCDCKSLTELDVSNWITYNISNVQNMFNGCESLTSLDLSNFNTRNSSLFRMFYGCTNLTSIKMGYGKVDELRETFANCTSLTDLDLSSYNVYNVNDYRETFYNCSKLTNFKAPKEINGNIDFSYCPKLTRDSLLSIINNLFSWAGTSYAGHLILTLGETNLAKLTASDKAKVTNKGWNLK